jgi:MFS family permease
MEAKGEIKIDDNIADISLRENAKKLSIKEGCAYGLMDGFGLRYITPYALALGLNNFYVGLLSSVPNLTGNLSQLYSLRLMEKNPRKKIVFWSVFLQALSWLLLISLGIAYFIFNISSAVISPLLILFYTVLVLCGAFAGPSWNSWMKDLVDKNSGHYFGRRNKICGFVALISMLIAAAILHYFEKQNLFVGFIILFSTAFFGRSLSAYLFTKKYEPKLKHEDGYYFSFFQFLKLMAKNNFGRFVIFAALVNFATLIASPFFAVYMLKELNFNYISFILVTISSSFASLIFMPLWGKFADKYGNLKAIRICSFLTIFVPFLWVASLLIHNSIYIIIYLMIVECFSGFSWAGYNLSVSNFIYDAVSRQRMALCSAYFNILNSIGIFFGAVIGGTIASSGIYLFSLKPIILAFILSGLIRLIVYFALSFRIKEVRKDVKLFGIKNIAQSMSVVSPLNIFRNFDLKIINPRPT